MATKPQLEARGRQIVKEIRDTMDDPKLTGAEKSEKLDKLKSEKDEYLVEVKACEAASEMEMQMQGTFGDSAGDFGGVKDAKTGKSIMKRVRSASPYATRGIDAANAVLESKEAEKLFNIAADRGVGVTEKSREKFDIAWEVGLKDASETNNLMGEFLYGTSGPTSIGQQPFGSTGAFAQGILPTWLPGIVEKLFYQMTLSDLISEFPVSTPNISYLTESLANFQANATGESQLIPWSSEAVARTYAQVGKVANAMTISDEAIADAPTLWNFVQGRLVMGVQRQEEVQILAGNGMPGVGGLLPTFASQFTASTSASLFGATSSTATNVAFPPAGTNGAGAVSQVVPSLPYGRVVTGVGVGNYATAVAVAENLADAFVDIELQVFQTPNAIVMHPRDWLTLRLAKDANGQYFNSSFYGTNYGEPGSGTVGYIAAGDGKRLWNVPVITTPLMPQHTILTGWFDSTTIQIARRKGITMQMSNSNGTDFVQGNITCRADSRLGLLCYRPSAFQLIQVQHA